MKWVTDELIQERNNFLDFLSKLCKSSSQKLSKCNIFLNFSRISDWKQIITFGALQIKDTIFVYLSWKNSSVNLRCFFFLFEEDMMRFFIFHVLFHSVVHLILALICYLSNLSMVFLQLCRSSRRPLSGQMDVSVQSNSPSQKLSNLAKYCQI